jgi:hypothetical protein
MNAQNFEKTFAGRGIDGLLFSVQNEAEHHRDRSSISWAIRSTIRAKTQLR